MMFILELIEAIARLIRATEVKDATGQLHELKLIQRRISDEIARRELK